MNLHALLLTGFAGFLYPAIGAAGPSCSFDMTDMDWGNIDPTSGQAFDLQGSLRIECSGIQTQKEIRICVHICEGSGGADAATSTRHMVNGQAQLQFNLYRETIGAGVWGGSETLCGTGSMADALEIVSTPDDMGYYRATVTAFGRIYSGQEGLPSGTYISSFSGGATYTTGNANCDVLMGKHEDITFTAKATVAPSCEVTASNLDFGTETLMASNLLGTSTVTVTCTNGHDYSVALDGGATAGGSTARRRLMKHTSSGSTIPYELYSDAGRTLIWGDSVSEVVKGTGTGETIEHMVYGRVPAQATAPEAGRYKDTVTVTVTY
jgi:spore coat protein U-like protein